MRELRIWGSLEGEGDKQSLRKTTAQDHLCWPSKLLRRVVILSVTSSLPYWTLSAGRPLAASICPFSDLNNSPTVKARLGLQGCHALRRHAQTPNESNHRTPAALRSAQQRLGPISWQGYLCLRLVWVSLERRRTYAGPLYRCTLAVVTDSIITSPEIHYISHNLHLHPTPLDYLEPRTSQSVHSPLLILLQATPIRPHLTLLLSLHIPLDFETNQSIVTYHHIHRIVPCEDPF